MIKIKKFVIKHVFYKINTIKIKKKANDFPTEYSERYCIPLLTAGIDNQGLARFAEKRDCPTILHNVISISANGANTGSTFYQPNEFAVLQDAYVIKIIDREIASTEEGLYLVCSLNKAIKGTYSWTNKAGWERIKNNTIELPIQTDKNNNPIIDEQHMYHEKGYIPDWQYMSERIAELESERIAELETYLQATGLDDYELTDEDKHILSLSRKSTSDKNNDLENNVGIRFKEFRLEELFKSCNGNTDIQKKHINDRGIYVITSGIDNTGILGKTNLAARIISSNTITVDMFGNAFYRDFEYKLVTHARVFALIPKNFTLDEKVGLYITSSLRCLSKIFSYENMCSYEKIKKIYIKLPVNSDDNPDYIYMQKYIKAIEKLVIADVVKYKNKVIETTKKII